MIYIEAYPQGCAKKMNPQLSIVVDQWTTYVVEVEKECALLPCAGFALCQRRSCIESTKPTQSEQDAKNGGGVASACVSDDELADQSA